MIPPKHVAEAILNILSGGIITIRALANSRAALADSTAAPRLDAIFVHADHIHNLPYLLNNFSRASLEHYYECMRPGFMRLCPDERTLAMHENDWRLIREYLYDTPSSIGNLGDL